MNSKSYFIYIISNYTRTVLYTGITNNLEKRLYEHENKLADGFTKKYNCNHLLYFEETNDIYAALSREKEIKGWKRFKKDHLILKYNPYLKDLSTDWE